MNPPSLITFDIFGTILDWRSGLRAACEQAGITLSDADFDRIVDAQAAIEHAAPATRYTTIVARSLTETLGMAADEAAAIGDAAGTWPLYPDAAALSALSAIAPCGAITNSDIAHRQQVQARLPSPLRFWLCAEEAGVYKPDPAMWRAIAARSGVAPGPHWWHVSAYEDYDLAPARALGLTTVFVARPHARAGAADYSVAGLWELGRVLERTK